MTQQAKPIKPGKAASPVKPATPATPATHAFPEPVSADETAFLEDEDKEVLQRKIDSSITRELEGIGHEIAGVRLRPLSMSAVMRLHEVGNEIMAGIKVKDMVNPLYAAAEFLYSLAEENDLQEVITGAFGPREEWRMKVSLWAESVSPSDTLVSDVIELINNTTSTRVKARLPKAMKGSSSEGNDSPHHGL